MTRHQYGISALASGSDVISRGFQRWCHEMPTAFSGWLQHWRHQNSYSSLGPFNCAKKDCTFIILFNFYPGKKADIWRRYHGSPAKWRLRNERRNSILMKRHFPDLGSVSGWSCRVGNLIQPIRSTTHISVGTRHQYGISAFVSQTSFGGETTGSVTKCRLVS